MEKHKKIHTLYNIQENIPLCMPSGAFILYVCISFINFFSLALWCFFCILQAYFAGNDFELAKKDFEKTCELEPSNKAAKNQVKICEQKIKQFDQKEKLKYKGMFEKFAAEDSKKVLFEEKMKWLLLSCTDVHVLF